MQKKNKSKEEPQSLLISIVQIFVAAVIMLGFGVYVWMIQLQYDVAADEKVWTGRIWMPIFYAITVAAAGFSYDCAKSVLFLKQATFKKFIAHFTNAVIYSFAIVFLMLSSFFLLQLSEPGAHFAGQVCYLIGLMMVWGAIWSVSNAAEIAARGDK